MVQKLEHVLAKNYSSSGSKKLTVYWQKIIQVVVHKINRLSGKKLLKSWFKKFNGILAKNLKGNGSKHLTAYWQKIIRVMVQKI